MKKYSTKRRAAKLKDPIMAIQGGLGNQLSQWYFAHTISRSSHFRIDPIYELSVVGLRNFELQPIIENCSHFERDMGGHFLSQPAKHFYKILDRLWEFSSLRGLVENLGYFREDPRFDQNQSSAISNNIKYAKGYFQKQSQIEKVFGFVEKELVPVVNKILNILSVKFDLESNYTVLHVRRGDYEATEFTPTIIGTLSDEYFTQGLNGFDSPNLILLTENREDVTDLINKLNPVLVLDKFDTTPWETLAVMYGASRFLGSNSSLSWWGARLCSFRGGEVWLPSQWSYWKNIDATDYHFPACNIANVYWGRDSLET